MKVDHENNFNLIRLCAALQVLLVHAVNHFDIATAINPVLKAVPGVPTFFFISGFLIFQSYERMRAQGHKAFFTNRFLRIYPGLIACFLVSILAVQFTGYFQDRSVNPADFLSWVLAQVTFLQFYNPDFMRDFGVGVLNGAMWTISVELQFYLLIPLLFLLIRRARILAVLLFVSSVGVNLWFRLAGDDESLVSKLFYVSFVPWIYMFMIGVAVASYTWVQPLVARIHWAVWFVGYVLSMNFIGTYEVNASNAINPISFLFLAGLVLKVAYTPIAARAPWQRFIRKNDFSYGLYLYHMPVINLLIVAAAFTAPANVALTIALAALAAAGSWYFIERPALRRKK